MRSKRSILYHLRKDQDFLKTIPLDTESAIFVKSCIDQTVKLLSQLRGGTIMPDKVSDGDRSHPEGSGGAFPNIMT
jgi:hypothetical protein